MSGLHVLFVCTANICRSPYMELHARHILGPDATVSFASAGTHGFEHRRMNAPMAALAAPGVDTSEFRSRPLTEEMLYAADLVLCAEASQRAFILHDQPALFRKVFTLGQFAEVVRRSKPDLTGPELVAAASTVSGIAQLQADVADPYRRGAVAAREAANQISELLDIVVPALARSGAEDT